MNITYSTRPVLSPADQLKSALTGAYRDPQARRQALAQSLRSEAFNLSSPESVDQLRSVVTQLNASLSADELKAASGTTVEDVALCGRLNSLTAWSTTAHATDIMKAALARLSVLADPAQTESLGLKAADVARSQRAIVALLPKALEHL